MPRIDPQTVALPSVAGLCAVCVRDAAHQCGMAGGARCPHIEQAGRGGEPEAWIVGRTGLSFCLDFESDTETAAALLH